MVIRRVFVVCRYFLNELKDTVADHAKGEKTVLYAERSHRLLYGDTSTQENDEVRSG